MQLLYRNVTHLQIDMLMTTRHAKNSLLLVLILAAGILTAGGYADILVDAVGMGSVSHANLAYLDDAFDRSLAGFLVLSGIKR